MKKVKLIWTIVASIMLTTGGIVSSTAQSAGDLAFDHCAQKWGADSIKTIQSISVYREFFKQGNYPAAMESWLYVFDKAPCAREQTHFDGVTMYRSYIKSEKDVARKKELTDTLFLIYEVRAANFKETAGNTIGRKAVDMLSYRPEPNTDVLKTFKRSIEMGGNATEYFVMPYYFKVALKEYALGKLTKEEVLSIYESMAKIIDFNVNANNNAEKYAESKVILDGDLAGNIIKDCDEILALFESKYKADPKNKDLRDLVYSLLLSKGCSDKELFFTVALSKYEDSPNARLAQALARRFQQADNIAQASKYFQKAIELAENDSMKAVYTYDYALLYSSTKQFAKARQLAYDAAKLMPNWGKPYIFIGDMYASSYNQCGTGIEAQAVYWAAIDKYQRAKSIDPSMADEAQAKINKYSAYFPNKEALFFASITPGSSHQVGCWISETTTVRSSD